MAGVLVLGSSNRDQTLGVSHLPTRGETCLGTRYFVGPGGKGANQAVAACRAGAEVEFVTSVGEDEAGDFLLEHFRREGIGTAHSKRVKEVSTGTALIFVAEDGENLIGVAPGANASLSPDDIDRLPDSLFKKHKVFLASLEIPLLAVHAGLCRAKQLGLTTVLNPAPARRDLIAPEILSAVDILTPNQEEAALLASIAGGGIAEARQAARKLRELGARHVLVTLGADGAWLSGPEGEVAIASFPTEVVDTVGAGDAFNGALAAALARGESLAQAARWAAAAGALAVTRPGAQGALATKAEIDRLARR